MRFKLINDSHMEVWFNIKWWFFINEKECKRILEFLSLVF